MPPNNYSQDKALSTWIERTLPPVLTYLVRKTVLGLILVNMYAVRIVSNRFGFDLSMEVSDRDSWKWNVREKLPLYRAQVEKVN